MQDIMVKWRDEALLRRSDSITSHLMHELGHCEELSQDMGWWLNSLPQTGDDFALMRDSLEWGWSLPAHDAGCGRVSALYTSTGLIVVALNAGMSVFVSQECYTDTNPSCEGEIFLFEGETNTVQFSLGQIVSLISPRM